MRRSDTPRAPLDESKLLFQVTRSSSDGSEWPPRSGGGFGGSLPDCFGPFGFCFPCSFLLEGCCDFPAGGGVGDRPAVWPRFGFNSASTCDNGRAYRDRALATIVGVGSTRKVSAVRWGVAGNIVWAWIFTIPASAFIAAIFWWAGTQVL